PFTDTYLSEEKRSRRIDLDSQGNERDKRKHQEKSQRGEVHIGNPFYQADQGSDPEPLGKNEPARGYVLEKELTGHCFIEGGSIHDLYAAQLAGHDLLQREYPSSFRQGYHDLVGILPHDRFIKFSL